MTSDITRSEYSNLATAYDHFNVFLFNSELPDCLITLKRDQTNRLGHYQPMVVRHRVDKTATDEIALNIASFPYRSDIQILSTLAHEMVHLWQEHLGEAPRKAYHDKQWGRKMKEIGLHPSNTGEPGGKETGQKMSHYVIEGGPFDCACQALLSSGYKINWQMELEQPEEKERKKSKVKYTCSSCEQKAWAKPGISLMCGDCMEAMEGEQDD
jgi:predicted SprT family Zn-dependent metalloprotease